MTAMDVIKMLASIFWNFCSALGLLVAFFLLVWLMDKPQAKPLPKLDPSAIALPEPRKPPKKKPSKLPKAPGIPVPQFTEMKPPRPLPSLPRGSLNRTLTH